MACLPGVALHFLMVWLTLFGWYNHPLFNLVVLVFSLPRLLIIDFLLVVSLLTRLLGLLLLQCFKLSC